MSRYADARGRAPRATATSGLGCHDDTTPADRIAAASARRLRPGVLTEDQWLRRSHADIPDLPDWQLRRELRIATAYIDTPQARRSWDLAWWIERRERLRAELRRREHAARPDRGPTPGHRDRRPPAQPPRPTRAVQPRVRLRGGRP